jgi:hypothetical protein
VNEESTWEVAMKVDDGTQDDSVHESFDTCVGHTQHYLPADSLGQLHTVEHEPLSSATVHQFQLHEAEMSCSKDAGSPTVCLPPIVTSCLGYGVKHLCYIMQCPLYVC